MTIPNRPSLADLARMPLGDIVALSGETLALLQEEADETLRRAKTAKDWLDGALDRKYGFRLATGLRPGHLRAPFRQ